MRSAESPAFRLPFVALLGLLLGALALPVQGAGVAVVVNQAQINHIALDQDALYWTEVASNAARLKTMPRGGGSVTILASEPTPLSGKLISYAQIQLLGDRVYWSRLATGGGTFWSIRSVPKTGGEVETVLPESTGANPLFTTGWRAAGGQLIATLNNAVRIGLPSTCRVAAFDPQTHAWRSLVDGRFQAGGAFITAVTDDQVFLRGIVPGRKTETGAAALDPLNPAYQALLLEGGVDGDADEPGATDGVTLYFWSRQNQHRLRRIPTAGGTATQRFAGALGHGLILDGGNLYWVTSRNLFRAPAASGPLARLFTSAFETSSVGGIAHDDTSVFVSSRSAQGKFSIVAVPK